MSVVLDFKRWIANNIRSDQLTTLQFFFGWRDYANQQRKDYRREEIIGKTPLDFSAENHKDFLVNHRKDIFSGELEDFESAIV
jgi:hypothetical protein